MDNQESTLSVTKVAAKSKIPNVYKDIDLNVFRSNELRLRSRVDGDPYVCSCTLENGGCNQSCHNRLLSIECDPETCPCSTKDKSGKLIPCANTAVQFSRYPSTKVVKARSGAGYCLRAAEAIKEDQIICEYRGQVISTEESSHRMAKYKPTDGFYFAALGNDLIIDASKMGSIARFANHSCDPNCSLQRWLVQNEYRLVLIANENLSSGTEITYSYNFNDDGFENNPIRTQRCLCGSQFCTGTVGGSNTIKQDITDAIHRGKAFLDGRKVSKDVVDAYISSTEKLLSMSSILRQLHRKLYKSMDQIDKWLNKHDVVFNANSGHFVMFDQVKPLLASIPTFWRAGEYEKNLTNMLRAAEDANTAIHTIRLGLALVVQQQENTEMDVVLVKEENIDVQESQQTQAAPATWGDIMNIIEMTKRAWPIYIEHIPWLISLLQPVDIWCQQAFSAMIPSSTVQGLISKNELRQQLIYNLSCYNVVAGDLPSYALGVADWLDSILSWQLLRQQQLQKKQEKHRHVECHCRLPEHARTKQVMGQCTVCEEWMHLGCLNIVDGRQEAKTAEDWLCAVCAFANDEVSAYALPVDVEWGSVAATTTSDIISPRGTSSQCKDKNKKRKQAAVVPVASSRSTRRSIPSANDEEGASAIATVFADHQENSSSSHSSSNNNNNTARKPTPTSTTKKEPTVKKEFLTVNELDHLLTSASINAMIDSSPVVALLKLAKGMLTTWQTQVDAFFEQFSEAISAHLQSGLSPQDSIDSIKSVFKKCVELYLEMRIIKLKDDSRLLPLRALLWQLSCSAILRRLARYEAMIKTEEAGNGVNNMNETLVRVMIPELHEMIRGGRMTLTNLKKTIHKLNEEVHVEVIKGLETLVHDVHEAVRMAKQPSDVDASLAKKLHTLRRVIDFDHEFHVAKVLTLAIKKPVSETGPYCWCRGDEDGRDMVSCDGCHEWFHHDCVNYQPPVPLHQVKKRQKISSSSSKEVEEVVESYLCIACCKEKRVDYVYR